ncbi:T9SS type A sorting domain-containing protein [Flavobacterium lindanitolerans]|nr:T9SS type A sorting domain-containing protein [Flavobacterium lindanitolerans]
MSPANNTNGVAPTVQLDWAPSVNAESYIVQVATDSGFGTPVVNQEVTETSYFLNNLTPQYNYYWRVLPKNRCATATTSTVYNFQTGALNCGQVFSATDFSEATIAATANAVASVPVLVTGGMTVGRLTATIDISHTYIEDMTIYLEGPEAIGSPYIKLFEEPCGDNDNIVATLSDAGIAFSCGATAPSISGTVKPLEPLSNFNNLPADGIWTLYAIDKYNGDGGVINSFSLNFCNVTPSSLTVADSQLANISVYPNPSKGILNVNLPANSGNTTLYLNDIREEEYSRKKPQTQMRCSIYNFSDGVYILTIQNGNLKTTKKIILNR